MIDVEEKELFFQLYKKELVKKGYMLEEDNVYDFVRDHVFVIDGEVKVVMSDYDLEQLDNRKKKIRR